MDPSEVVFLIFFDIVLTILFCVLLRLIELIPYPKIVRFFVKMRLYLTYCAGL